MLYWTDLANQFLIFSILAMSLNLLVGYTGQLSVAQGAFAAVGGYTVAYLTTQAGWSFVSAVLLSMAVAVAIGVAVAIPGELLSSEYLVLLTLAVQTIVIVVISEIAILGGLYGVGDIPSPQPLGEELFFPADWFPWLLLAFVVVLVLMTWLADSPFGRVLIAIQEDQLATQSLGKDVFIRKIVVFAITAAVAAVGGALYGVYNTIVTPTMFGFATSTLIIAMVVLGGRANMLGAVLGAAIVSLSQPLFENVLDMDADKASLVRMAAFGILLVVVLVVRPEGLLPIGVTPWGALGRRARRRDKVEAFDAETLSADVADEASTDNPEPARAVVRVEGLKKSFGGIHAVQGLSFELAQGRVTGLIGPNGAGKTTVYNLLTGVTVPDEGSVELYGVDITAWPIDRVARHGMVRSFQDVRVFPAMTVLQNVQVAVPGQEGERLGRLFLTPWRAVRDERRSRHDAMRALALVGLTDKAEQPVRLLPFGEQKLVALARILAAGAQVILLDEPASGIDAEWVDRMADIIKRLRSHGLTVCLVEHNLHFVERVADHVYFMEAGRITAQGTMKELSADERLVEVYFGRP